MAKRKADRVAEDLLSRIVSGEHATGDTLPTENELADHYGANRSVVREAIKKLEVHRLVRPIRRKGTVVLDPVASLSPEVLRAMLVPRGGTIDVEVLKDMLEVRALIDVEMTGLAAERRRPEHLEALEACVDELERLRGRPREYAAGVNEIALCLARASGNVLFEMLVHWHRRVYQDLEQVLMLTRMPSEAHIGGLRLLVSLIASQDAIAVRELTRQFHDWAIPRILGAVRQLSSIPENQPL